MPRVVVSGFPHHVTQRGNRRQETFFCTDDYQYYLELMSEYTRQSGTEVWAYCLMPNHVHLVMVPGSEDGLRASLGEVHRRYTRYINFRKGWRGHLWQERFHSFPMDENYLLATVRYVELNPVKAKLCTYPQDWMWSSAAAHLARKDDNLVTVKPMLDRVENWQQYLTKDDSSCNDLVALHTRTGRPLGSNSFVMNLENICGKSLAPMRAGRKPTKKC
jgi:putative transposase